MIKKRYWLGGLTTLLISLLFITIEGLFNPQFSTLFFNIYNFLFKIFVWFPVYLSTSTLGFIDIFFQKNLNNDYFFIIIIISGVIYSFSLGVIIALCYDKIKNK